MGLCSRRLRLTTQSFHQELFVDTTHIIADDDELPQDSHHQLDRTVLTSSVEANSSEGTNAVTSDNEASPQLVPLPSLHVYDDSY